MFAPSTPKESTQQQQALLQRQFLEPKYIVKHYMNKTLFLLEPCFLTSVKPTLRIVKVPISELRKDLAKRKKNKHRIECLASNKHDLQ
jgi:hypothetical protein